MLKDFATANGRYIKCVYRDLNSLNSHTDVRFKRTIILYSGIDYLDS